MTPLIYIKKRLLGDMICLLVVSGLTYLAIDTWNAKHIEDNSTLDLVQFNENTGVALD